MRCLAPRARRGRRWLRGSRDSATRPLRSGECRPRPSGCPSPPRRDSPGTVPRSTSRRAISRVTSKRSPGRISSSTSATTQPSGSWSDHDLEEGPSLDVVGIDQCAVEIEGDAPDHRGLGSDASARRPFDSCLESWKRPQLSTTVLRSDCVELVDLLVLVEGVVVVVRGRHLLEDHAGLLGPERVPDAGLHQDRVARVKLADVAVDLRVQHAVEDLEGLFLAGVVVGRVPLVGQLDHQLLAVLAVDALDQHGADGAEIRDAVVVGVLDHEVRPRWIRASLSMAFTSWTADLMTWTSSILRDRRWPSSARPPSAAMSCGGDDARLPAAALELALRRRAWRRRPGSRSSSVPLRMAPPRVHAAAQPVDGRLLGRGDRRALRRGPSITFARAWAASHSFSCSGCRRVGVELDLVGGDADVALEHARPQRQRHAHRHGVVRVFVGRPADHDVRVALAHARESG